MPLKVVEWLAAVCGYVLLFALSIGLISIGPTLVVRWVDIDPGVQALLAVATAFAGLWLALLIGARLTGHRRL